ncbi:MAG TPA: ATP-binding protein [Leptospiraceae bacterium]|nr:ATP-binding protein [Leptospiraceae bacterium]
MSTFDSIKIKQNIFLGLGLGIQIIFWNLFYGYFSNFVYLVLFFISNICLFWAVTKFLKKSESEKRSQEPVSSHHILSSIGGIIWEANADSLQYTFIEGNSENLLGYTKEEWTSVDFWVNNVYSQDKEPTLKKFREILKNKKSNFLEYRFFTKHRKLSWIRDTIGVIDNKVQPPLVQGIIIDITDHKRNENLLQFHSDILNKMSEGVFLLRTDDASIIYTNPSFDSMFGYETGELIGKHVSILNSSEIKPSESIAEEINAVLYRDGFWSGEVFNRKKNGISFWCAVNVSEYEHPEYGLVWISVHNEISKRKKIEADLLKAKLIAEEANKAKSEFLAMMSHEIRTPLNSILGMTSLLVESELSARERNHAQIAFTGAELLLNIVNDIMDFSKIESGKIEIENIRISLKEISDSIYEMFYERASEKRIEFKSSIDETIAENLIGDSYRLRQILINLIGNALKFTSVGKVQLKIKLENESEDFQEILFTISDTGIGMDDDVKRRLFESFYQRDSSITRKYGGVGLGLSICKQLIDLMGGKIWVESQEGKGSTFYFRLKLERKDTHNYSHYHSIQLLRNEPSSKVEFKKKEVSIVKNINIRVLVVDDDVLNATMMTQILQNKGILKIKHSYNGLEAIKDFKESEYDLVLMDIRMPEMDGYESTRVIRQISQVPIVAVTAEALEGEKEKCLLAGMSDFYTKPISVRTLVKILNDWT